MEEENENIDDTLYEDFAVTEFETEEDPLPKFVIVDVGVSFMLTLPNAVDETDVLDEIDWPLVKVDVPKEDPLVLEVELLDGLIDTLELADGLLDKLEREVTDS